MIAAAEVSRTIKLDSGTSGLARPDFSLRILPAQLSNPDRPQNYLIKAINCHYLDKIFSNWQGCFEN